ncbi:MMPL family transporter [Streptomyces sp. NBC_01314]|uniref:MMPL family transporter n=1 Tax=Streptomyces sp. NBC_01314 TaxID=2903821 RepID=UPI00352F8A7F
MGTALGDAVLQHLLGELSELWKYEDDATDAMASVASSERIVAVLDPHERVLLPVVLIGVVFGLAMDYEVFLVSRMREEYVHSAEPTQAVVEGFRHSGRVVTAAAVIMLSVFSGFLLDDEALIKSIGLGLATAVFIDAFVVRMTIVPAVMALLGHRSWALPKWLDRILPDVDVEGEKLRHALEAEQTDSAPEPVFAGVAAGVHAGSDDHGAPAPSPASRLLAPRTLRRLPSRPP